MLRKYLILPLLCLLSGGTAAMAAGDGGTARPQTGLSLRTNLLRLATLTPDLGVEWRFRPQWSVVAEGAWTSLSWESANRRYALGVAEVGVRRYLGRAYVGLQAETGKFHCKLSRIGREGTMWGGGVQGGYSLPVQHRLRLDFSLTLGCLHYDYDTYRLIDGVRVFRSAAAHNYLGPTACGVSLVWDISPSVKAAK